MSKRTFEEGGNAPSTKSLRTDGPSSLSPSSTHHLHHSRLWSNERVLFRVLSYCAPDELFSTSINVSVMGGTKVKLSDSKCDLQRVCKAWNSMIVKWSSRETMIDISFRRKLLRSQMKCENEKRWDVLSIGYLNSTEEDVIKSLTHELVNEYRPPPSKDERETQLKSLVPPFATNLPSDQLQQMLTLPILNRSIYTSQLTQLYIPYLNDDYIFQNLSQFTSLSKLYAFKYQMKTPLEVKSKSLRELDLDVEEFDEDGERIYYPLDFSTLECPNLRRLRLSGLSLPSPATSPSFKHLFECLDSKRMTHLRHLQLELRLPEEEGGKIREGEEAAAHLRSTSLQRLSLDNYYADYFFNVVVDCPNMTSVYLRCIKLSHGEAFTSFCNIAANRNIKLWLDYITLHTLTCPPIRIEETNIHFDIHSNSNSLRFSRGPSKKVIVNGSTLSFDDGKNAVEVVVDGQGVWVECDGRKTRYERKQEVRIEIEGERESEKGRLIVCK